MPILVREGPRFGPDIGSDLIIVHTPDQKSQQPLAEPIMKLEKPLLGLRA